MRVRSLLIASALLFSVYASAQTVEDINRQIERVEKNIFPEQKMTGDTPTTIQQRMLYYKIPGLSMAVIHNYKIEWTKTYGWADKDLQIPVTTQTLFQAASISKSLNAVGILKLVEDKKLDLYTDINNYLGAWKFPYDSLSKNKKITVANLLSHTGGLTVHGFAGYGKGEPVPSVIQVLDGKIPANSAAIRSAYEPGLKYEYSGGGVTISQLILTDITHQPYELYMYQNVLKPLGMTSSSYAQPPVANAQLLATGYRPNGTEIPGKYHIYPEQAAAGLWTHPTDLAKYVIETQLTLAGKSGKVLNQATTQLRLTPYIDKTAALGVFVENLNGTKYFQHSGANAGFRSYYIGSLEDGNGVVIMINSDNGGIINEIINSVADAYNFRGLNRSTIRKTVMVDDAVLDSYTGQYQLAPQFILTITREGHQLYAQATGQVKSPVYAEKQNRFFLKNINAAIEFMSDESGTVTKAILYQNGAHEAKKIK